MSQSVPNFLLIIADQLRADHLACYGNKEIKTPNLDALAARGWRAERFYVATPICMPNRASLMTGRMPSLHGARHNGVPLPLESNTFVDVLRQAGWGTALVGKAHLQNITDTPPLYPRPEDPPTRGEARAPLATNDYGQECGQWWRDRADHGVQLPFYGYEHVDLAIDHGDQVWGDYGRWLQNEHPDIAALSGPENAIPTPDYALSRIGQAWRTRVPEEYSTTAWIGERTRAMLDHYAQEQQPFFIQCSFPDPHHPFTPHGQYWDMYKPEDVSLPDSFHLGSHPLPAHLQLLHQLRDEGKAVKHTPTLFACTEREAREAIALNYGSITHIDAEIGRILDHLEHTGQADNTIVMFMSDHGDFMGDHQLLLKGPLHYQSIIRSPFIWFDPRAAQTQGTSAAVCSTIDIAPTVLERANQLPYNGIQGRSLLKLMHNDAQTWRSGVLIEEENQRKLFNTPIRTKLRSLVTPQHRISLYEGGQIGELYDLHADPLEQHNLWNEPDAQALKTRLLCQLIDTMMAHSETSPLPLAIA
ncbi:sulfatase family protein [Alcaligenes sp. HNGD-HTN06]|uniref:sulfatase family protein n=1 Tax=Alcaligenes sp. HNGD-HTN06 TaxID=3416924 RepID=UPI002BCBAF6E|nr:sulfatase-like hydrolase/transferase [Alcaligenes faecalis]